jgi:hypothetical protein
MIKDVIFGTAYPTRKETYQIRDVESNSLLGEVASIDNVAQLVETFYHRTGQNLIIEIYIDCDPFMSTSFSR